MAAATEAFFLSAGGTATGGDQRFCLFHAAQGGRAQGLVLYLHPFAEELNKTRRMAALQARALAQAGYAVLQIDLLGCGDSSGDFGDATWQRWIDDVVLACQWLRAQPIHPPADASAAPLPLWLWGLRAGCLVAVDAARQMPEPCNFLFWQPAVSGKPLLQQFLRIKLAGEMLGGQAKGLMQSMREQLAAGSPVEVAGYTLSPELASGLERSELAPGAATATAQRLEWFEIDPRADAALNPVSVKTIAQWSDAGYAVRSHIVQAPAFWQTAEIEDAPALIAATVAAIA